ILPPQWRDPRILLTDSGNARSSHMNSLASSLYSPPNANRFDPMRETSYKLDTDQLRLARAGDFRFPGTGHHIDLAAHAELAGKINARFDGEAGVGQDEPRVIRLEIVEVRAVAVQFGTDVVSCA